MKKKKVVMVSCNDWTKNAVKQYGIRNVDTFMDAYPALSDEIELHFDLQPCERDEDLLERLKAIQQGMKGNGQMGLYSSAVYICQSTNSRSPKDIEKLMDAVKKGNWEFIVGRIVSYRQSAMSDKNEERNRCEISYDDHDNGLELAEKIAYKHGHYCNGISQIAAKIDAERMFGTKKSTFDKYGIDKDDAMRIMVMASKTLNKDFIEIVNDIKFEIFLTAVTKKDIVLAA